MRDNLWCTRARLIRAGDEIRLKSWDDTRRSWWGGEVLVVVTATVKKGRVEIHAHSKTSSGSTRDVDILGDDYVELASRSVEERPAPKEKPKQPQKGQLKLF